jgi:hypothetical protein
MEDGAMRLTRIGQRVAALMRLEEARGRAARAQQGRNGADLRATVHPRGWDLVQAQQGGGAAAADPLGLLLARLQVRAPSCRALGGKLLLGRGHA